MPNLSFSVIPSFKPLVIPANYNLLHLFNGLGSGTMAS